MTTPGNRASGSAPAYIDPHLAMLVRVSGRTLLLIFLVAVAAAIVPFNPRSLDWGIQFSNRIVQSLSGLREEGGGHHPSRLWCCGRPVRAALALPVASRTDPGCV